MKLYERCPACHRRHTRSNPQNRLYWLLLHLIAEKIKPEGHVYSADSWHLYFKSRFLGCDDVTLPNGKTVAIPRSTASLDVAEFSEYVTKLEAWAASRDVYLDEMETA